MKKSSFIKIGKNLKAIRQSHGYTQEKLAEEIEVSTRYISDIEQDKSKPSYDVLIKFCNLFNIGINIIFKDQLKIEEKKDINFYLTGFNELSKNDQETIQYLIMYFNKKTKNEK